MDKAKIGVIGLAVMGANLARNFSRNYKTVVYNRTTKKTEEFIIKYGNDKLIGEKDLESFIDALETPKKIVLMVKAGTVIDKILEQLTPLLEKNDIVIDGGNSHYKDTERRQTDLKKKKINFIGMGVSGGEEGALNGPSMMPGGDEKAYKKVSEILEKSSAKDGLGGRCVTYIGPNGSGHFVKMVHNGIEYAIMQLIAETYDVLKKFGKFSNKELAETFEEWSKTEDLKSFLIEITAKIFKKKNPEDKTELINLIKDTAKQKGTGKWTSEEGFNYGSSTSIINSAVDARILSGAKTLRKNGENFIVEKLAQSISIPKKDLKNIARDALILGTINSYCQGIRLLKKVSKENNWNLNLAEIARIWLGGCIIRSDFLLKLKDRLKSDEVNEGAKKIIDTFKGETQKNWRRFANIAIANAIPAPATLNAISYYDALHQDKLPQNLIQAQRDLFGAHTYKRTDEEGIFHTDWN